jgi:hypothetical protein
MKRATPEHKKKILDAFFEAFNTTPGILWVTGTGRQKDKKVRWLLEFAYQLTSHSGEIWMSDDENAVSFMFYSHKRKGDWYTLWLHLKLAFQVVGLRRALEILRRERYIRQQRPANEPYIYLWFTGSRADRNGLISMTNLKNGLFKKGYDENLPIYTETTVERALASYTRYGFSLFHSWPNLKRHLTVYFFRRQPSLEGITD